MVTDHYGTNHFTEAAAEDGDWPLHYKHYRSCSWKWWLAITLQTTLQKLQLKMVTGHYTTNHITEAAAEDGNWPLHYKPHYISCSWRWWLTITLQTTLQNPFNQSGFVQHNSNRMRLKINQYIKKKYRTLNILHTRGKTRERKGFTQLTRRRYWWRQLSKHCVNV